MCGSHYSPSSDWCGELWKGRRTRCPLLWEGEQAPVSYLILSRGVTFVGSRNWVCVVFSRQAMHERLSEQEANVYPKVTLLVSIGLLSYLWGLKSDISIILPITFTWLSICMPSFHHQITAQKYPVHTYRQMHWLAYVCIGFLARSKSLTWKTVLASATACEGILRPRPSAEAQQQPNPCLLPLLASTLPLLFCPGIFCLG